MRVCSVLYRFEIKGFVLPKCATCGEENFKFAKDEHNQLTVSRTRQTSSLLYQIIAARLVSRAIVRSIVIVNCPQCTSERIHQSKRKGIIERILAMLFVRPFRCERCDLR